MTAPRDRIPPNVIARSEETKQSLAPEDHMVSTTSLRGRASFALTRQSLVLKGLLGTAKARLPRLLRRLAMTDQENTRVGVGSRRLPRATCVALAMTVPESPRIPQCHCEEGEKPTYLPSLTE